MPTARTATLFIRGKLRQPGAGVVVGQQRRGARMPRAVDPQANGIVRADVADVIRPLTELGHQPEFGALSPATDGRDAGLSADAAGGLEECLARQSRGERVGDVPLELHDDPSFDRVEVGHDESLPRGEGSRRAFRYFAATGSSSWNGSPVRSAL